MVCGRGRVGLELPCYLLDYLRYIVPGQWNCRITVVNVPSAAGDCLYRPGFYRIQTRIGTLPLPGTLRWHITNNNNNNNINTAETNNQAITMPRVCHLLVRRFLPRMRNVHLPIIATLFSLLCMCHRYWFYPSDSCDYNTHNPAQSPH